MALKGHSFTSFVVCTVIVLVFQCQTVHTRANCKREVKRFMRASGIRRAADHLVQTTNSDGKLREIGCSQLRSRKTLQDNDIKDLDVQNIVDTLTLLRHVANVGNIGGLTRNKNLQRQILRFRNAAASDTTALEKACLKEPISANTPLIRYETITDVAEAKTCLNQVAHYANCLYFWLITRPEIPVKPARQLCGNQGVLSACPCV